MFILSNYVHFANYVHFVLFFPNFSILFKQLFDFLSNLSIFYNHVFIWCFLKEIAIKRISNKIGEDLSKWGKWFHKRHCSTIENDMLIVVVYLVMIIVLFCLQPNTFSVFAFFLQQMYLKRVTWVSISILGCMYWNAAFAASSDSEELKS